VLADHLCERAVRLDKGVEGGEILADVALACSARRWASACAREAPLLGGSIMFVPPLVLHVAAEHVVDRLLIAPSQAPEPGNHVLIEQY
jgi:hypothetical protein